VPSKGSGTCTALAAAGHGACGHLGTILHGWHAGTLAQLCTLPKYRFYKCSVYCRQLSLACGIDCAPGRQQHLYRSRCCRRWRLRAAEHDTNAVLPSATLYTRGLVLPREQHLRFLVGRPGLSCSSCCGSFPRCPHWVRTSHGSRLPAAWRSAVVAAATNGAIRCSASVQCTRAARRHPRAVPQRCPATASTAQAREEAAWRKRAHCRSRGYCAG
jgi:hypothetical protein